MAEPRTVERSTKITDQEYQFPDNIAEERLRAVLTARRIIRSDKIRYRKEDLIRLFKRFLQPLLQRSTQLRRCNALRLPGKLSLQNERKRLRGHESKNDDAMEKDNICCPDSKGASKPVKLKRQHGNDDSRPPRQSKVFMHINHKHDEEADAQETRDLNTKCGASHKDSEKISNLHTDISKGHSSHANRHHSNEMTSSHRHLSEHQDHKFNAGSVHSDKRQEDAGCQPIDADHNRNEGKRKSRCSDSTVSSDKRESTDGKKKEKIPKITWP